MPDLPKYRLVLVDNTDPECTTELLAENYGLEVRYDREHAFMVVAPRGADEDALEQFYKELQDYATDLSDSLPIPWSAAFPEWAERYGTRVHSHRDLFSPERWEQFSELAASVKCGFAELELLELDEGTGTYVTAELTSGAHVNDASLVDWRRVAFSDFPQCTAANTQFDFTGHAGVHDIPAQITWVLPAEHYYGRAKARDRALKGLEEMLGENLFTRTGAHEESVEVLSQDSRLMLIDIDPYGYVSNVRLPISPDEFDMSWEPVTSAELEQSADGGWALLLGEPVAPGEDIPLVPDDYLYLGVKDVDVVAHIFGPMLTEYQHRTGKSQPLWTGTPDLHLGLPEVGPQPGLGV